MYRFMESLPQSGYRAVSSSPQNSFILSICSHNSPTSLTLVNHWSILSSYSFDLGKSYKWNHTVCNLLRLIFSFNAMPLKFIQFLLCFFYSFLLDCHVIFHCMDMYHSSSIEITEEHLDCLKFGKIMNRIVINSFVQVFV